MGVDECLLATAHRTSQPTLRIYQWDQPTLSLGYFQSFPDRQQQAFSGKCPCVRRHSGGGAILHHHELTYSVIVPILDRWSPTAEQLYRRVHEGLASLFRRWGLHCSLWNGAESDKAFLCFERRASGDLVSGEHKITGSAQRRQRGALLQHGSLLLSGSSYAPHLPGIFDLTGTSLPREDVQRAVAHAMAETLTWELREEQLTSDERDQAARLVEQKFGKASWTHRR